MDAYKIYQQWLAHPHLDPEAVAELDAISDRPTEIEDRFYKHLEFGTGGIRAVLGAGRNRINRYTIRRVTTGLAHYISSFGTEACNRGVVIAYDSRHQSRAFALETATTLLCHHIKAYVFQSPSPTPLLSFAVRQLHTIAGIVITASHNPAEYNGYKVYWEDGAQIVPHRAEAIANMIHDIEDIPALPNTQPDPISWLKDELQDEYIIHIKNLFSRQKEQAPLKIVYTPLHGTGGIITKKLLTACKFDSVWIVPEQEHPDPDFPTVSLPNPEATEAFDLAIALGKRVDADLILATDPDCDRVGVMVKHGNAYEHLTGNQVGALLLHNQLVTLTNENRLPENGVLLKTIVTGNLGQTIAKKYQVETIETLTGFKYIGEKIHEFEKSGEKSFLFGYEESCGYLADPIVRDKDGIMTILLLCEMATYYKQKNTNLYQALDSLYLEHGTFLESLESQTFLGKDGMEKMTAILQKWRTQPPEKVGTFHISKICDYLHQKWTDPFSGVESPLDLPQENVLHFTCEDGSWFCLRPSGTEPKLKIYFAVQGDSKEETHQKLTQLIHEVTHYVH